MFYINFCLSQASYLFWAGWKPLVLRGQILVTSSAIISTQANHHLQYTLSIELQNPSQHHAFFKTAIIDSLDLAPKTKLV